MKHLKTWKIHKFVVILKGDKDSTIVLMNRSDYIEKLKVMIDARMRKGLYEVTNDSTLQGLKCFQDFLHRNLRGYEH